MPITILFDLDDTLIHNQMETFLPVYLKLLGKSMAAHVSPQRMVPALLAATEGMTRKSTPRWTLEESFDQSFYPAIGVDRAALDSTITEFYTHTFQDLQPFTAPVEGAAELVRGAIAARNTVVVATNPVFPRVAIEHRLRWAGIPAETVPFDLITSYETFHFAKPTPAYFAEILGRLGWPGQPVVMIGNSLEDDLIPASKLGMPVYWVVNDGKTLPEGFHPLSSSGSLQGVAAWLQSIETRLARLPLNTPQAILPVLQSTPAVIDTLTRSLSQDDWRHAPAPDEWSPVQLLCHLRDTEAELNLPRLKRALVEDNPILPGVNADEWAAQRNYLLQDGPDAVEEFLKNRTELVSLLETLTPEQWLRPARHTIFGPTNLLELMGIVATHDCLHIQQCLKAVKFVRV